VVSQIHLVYYSAPHINHVDNSPPVGELRPAWRFRITGEDAIVDAYTGELQGVDWEPGIEPTVTKAMKKFENNPLSDKIPVPRRISFIDGGKEIWHINPTDAEFGPIFKEAQEILSKLRPYYEKKADVISVSNEKPQSVTNGGLLLQYDGKERLVTESKIGRDVDKKDLPTGEKERRMNYTKDGYYRLYARDVFICFNESRPPRHALRGTPQAIYWGQPLTEILTTTRGNTYFHTYALAPNDELIRMTYKQAEPYIPMPLRTGP
jgi:hypothetical protein